VELVWSGVGKDEYAFQPGGLDLNTFKMIHKESEKTFQKGIFGT